MSILSALDREPMSLAPPMLESQRFHGLSANRRSGQHKGTVRCHTGRGYRVDPLVALPRRRSQLGKQDGGGAPQDRDNLVGGNVCRWVFGGAFK
jgi:hypothetical protein